MIRRLFILTTALVAALLLVWYGPRLVYEYYGYLFLEKTQESPPEVRATKTEGLPKGRLAFSSSRSGGHELYLMDLPSRQLTRLTMNDHVDTFPRFSPDGRLLVFVRSTRPWVSERDPDSWDVWLLDLAHGRERRLCSGNYPQWVDGGRISLLRGSRVILRELESGAEKVLFDGAGPPLSGLPLGPELSPDGTRLCFTARGRLRGVYSLDLARGKLTGYGFGCEITWLGGDRVLWVENAGRGKTRLAVSPAGQTAPAPLIDLPGGHSHEFFPRPSRDGRWLVWAASAEGHEHDVADYELFLWRVGDPPAGARRITFNAANDRWPDLHLAPTQVDKGGRGG